jgi:uncharacterized lipoprotein YmbA
MSKATKIFRLFLMLLLIALVTACASSKNSNYYKKKKQSSKAKTEQLGRNKYYFSPGYQKKLNSNYKKK